MLLSAQIMKLLKTQLTALGYSSWANLAPDETSFPFVVYTVSTMNLDLSFKENYEYMRATLSVFSDDPSYTAPIAIMNAIETKFHRNQTLTIDAAVGTLICIKKINEIQPIKATSNYNSNNDDFYSMGVIEFQFIAQRTQP